MKASFSTLRLCLLTVAGVMLMIAATQAATVAVTNTNNGLAGSLRQTIQDADPGDTVIFQIPTTDPGYNAANGTTTITLTGGEIAFGKDLTIDGAGGKVEVTRSSNAYFRLFNITAGDVKISNLTLTFGDVHNVQGNGGAVRNAGVLTLSNCTLTNNYARSGAGVYNDVGGNLTVSRCTIAGNFGDASGGGIGNAGTLRVDNSTLTENEDNTGGGAIFNEAGGTAHVRNTILANNDRDHTSQAVGDDVMGDFVSDGYNFVGKTDGSTGFGSSGSHDQIGTNAAPADAKLGPLQDNGGLTMTARPLAGSPVIDQGKRGADANGQPINLDQRGYPGAVDQPGISNASGGDGSDVGAVEVGLPQAGPHLYRHEH